MRATIGRLLSGGGKGRKTCATPQGKVGKRWPTVSFKHTGVI